MRLQPSIHQKTGVPYVALDTPRLEQLSTPLTSSSPRVGVGWQQRCETRHPLRKLGNQVPIFCALAFFAVTMMVVELDHMRGERTSIPRKGDDHTT